MMELAQSFESKVGNVIKSVADSSSEMQMAARAMSTTADMTSQQSTTVAATSEEATVNVQTVAAATGIDIDDTGLASKDRSTLTAKNVTIKGAKFAALTAYIKKPEYGGATIIADDITINGGNTRNLVQNGSRIVLAGRTLATQDIDITRCTTPS
jgi:hypothetical protein